MTIINISTQPNAHIKLLNNKIQSIIGMWNELLALSGGALSTSTIFFYVLQWQWNNGQASLFTPATNEVEIKDEIYNHTIEVSEMDMNTCKR